jgi:hypothetical protein
MREAQDALASRAHSPGRRVEARTARIAVDGHDRFSKEREAEHDGKMSSVRELRNRLLVPSPALLAAFGAGVAQRPTTLGAGRAVLGHHVVPHHVGVGLGYAGEHLVPNGQVSELPLGGRRIRRERERRRQAAARAFALDHGHSAGFVVAGSVRLDDDRPFVVVQHRKIATAPVTPENFH